MKDKTRCFYEDAVRAAVERIARNLDQALDLTELAALACLSPLHFHAPTQFRKRMNEHRERMNFPERFPFELPARSGIHFGQPSGGSDIIMASGGPQMDIVVVEMNEVRLAAITYVGPRKMIGEAFGRLAKVAGPAGLLSRPGATMAAVFHDDAETTPAAELRSSAAVVVPDDCVLPAELSELRIPAGRYARAIHRGHYAGLSDSWDRLMGQWLPSSGYRVDDRVAYEVYRVADHSRPDSLETDLYLAIA